MPAEAGYPEKAAPPVAPARQPAEAPGSPPRGRARPAQAAEACKAEELSSGHMAKAIVACAGDLRSLWAQSASRAMSEDPAAPSAVRYVLEQNSGMGPPRFRTALLNPPGTGPPMPTATMDAPDAPMSATNSAGSATSSPASSAGVAPWDEPPLTVLETLEPWRQPADDPELSADSALHNLIGSVMKSCHRESELHRPCPEAVLAGLGHQERETILLWIFQVCALRGLSDHMLYSTVLLLDRYCASSRTPLPMGPLHIAVIAILGIALKVTGGADELTKPRKVRELLAHLGQNRFSIDEVFRVEIEVLQALDFNVSAPSAIDFFTTFSLPISRQAKGAMSPVVCLAQFLLQLSMLNVQVHHRYPHAVLAAGEPHIVRLYKHPCVLCMSCTYTINYVNAEV